MAVRITVSETGDVESTELVSGNPVLADYQQCKAVKAAIKLPFDFAPLSKATDVPPKLADASSSSEKEDAAHASRQPKTVKAQATRVAPEYPPVAKAARLQGGCGARSDCQRKARYQGFACGQRTSALTQASIDAVKQWQYMPHLLNGRRIQVQTTVTVTFRLAGSRPD